jgi:endonuclease/exonuclease/phosphatase family metal-dependent hydrolase
MKLTIAAINLQSGVATTKGKWQYALTGWKYWLPHSDKPIKQAGKMLKEENVDIACITEISEKSLRTGFRSQTETLAESAAMDHKRFFSSQKIGKFIFHEGNALLSKYPISNPASHLLHRELNMRMALEEATVEIEGKSIAVFIAHLALTKKHRQIQIKEIIELIKERKEPIILAGDFNERNPEALDILLKETSLKHKCTLETFPSWNPRHSFDYIFFSKEFNVLDCYIQKSPAFSDHAALLVKAEIE